MRYEHTQVGYWMLAVNGTLVLVVGLRAQSPPFGLVLGALLTAIWCVFGRLTVTIDGGAIRCWFGFLGWPRESFALADVRCAQVVRTSPLAGWGMRYTLHGRLWNVWGLDAVELQLANGSRFRIGTDEPKRLLNALRAAGVGT